MQTPSYLESAVKTVIDMAGHGVAQHFARKVDQQRLVREHLVNPESAVFRITIPPLRESIVWGGLVSANGLDGVRSPFTRYLAYLHEDPTRGFVMLEGDGLFHRSPSDPEIFQEKWGMFTRS